MTGNYTPENSTRSASNGVHWQWTSRLTHHFPVYFSWRPDPQAAATDAFLQIWSTMRCYANPPWELMLRVILEISHQQAEVVIVVPVWKSQSWYLVLFSLLFGFPRLISSPTGSNAFSGTSITSVLPSTNPTGHMAHLREYCQPEKLSKQASELLMASWRDKSTVLQLTLSQVGELVYFMGQKSHLWSCSRYCNFFGGLCFYSFLNFFKCHFISARTHRCKK